MKRFLLVLVTGLSVSAAPTLTDLNISLLGSDQQYLEAFYTLPNGDPHVVYGLYPVGKNWQLWDIGLSNGVSQVWSVSPGHPALKAHIPTSVNSVVIGSNDPGHLWEYWPLTGETNYIKACSSRDYYSAAMGTDGVVVLGCYGGGGGAQSTFIETYDPVTQTAVEWGQIDVGEIDPTYVYTVGGDSTAVYGAIFHSGAPINWYLGAVQKSDGAKQVFWKDGVSTAVNIFKGSGDNNWYVVQVTNSVTRYWQLNGTNYPTELGGNPGLQSFYRHSSQNNLADTWLAEEGWEVEPTFAVAQVAGSIPECSIRWRKSGVSEWTSLTETNGWTVGPYTLLKLVPFNNQLIWTADAYGPIGYMTRHGALTLVGSQAGLSWYDLLVVGNDDVYISGYHNRTKRWDPTSPWTYSVSASDTDPTVNPHHVILNTLGKYHFYLAKASDGRIYVGSHHERGTTGGELGWFDPSDSSVGEERTTFLSYDVRDLKPAVGGTKLVYVSSNADGKVFVWDVATDTVDTSFSPLGAVVLDKVVEYESGKMFGITGNRTFAFDLSGTLLLDDTIPATAWGGLQAYDHRLTLGPDGHIWQCAGGNLYKIKPQDGTYESIVSTTVDYNTVFLGSDLFLYGRTSAFKITNAVQAISRATNVNVGTLRGR